MHKGKDGKVTASLTEVKNKTGDIFDLVDEYGEVLLTSYNKARYRITKIDISEMLQDKKAPKKSKKKSLNGKKQKNENIAKVDKTEPNPKIVAIEPVTENKIEKPIVETKTEPEVKVEVTPVVSETKEVEPVKEVSETPVSEVENNTDENKFSNMEVWDRNNSKEQERVKIITANLL